MKTNNITKLLTVLLLVFLPVSILSAQNKKGEETAITYYQQMKSKFKNLDFNKLENGILYDLVYPLANLREFTGAKADTSNSDHFFQSAYELHLASNNKSKASAEYFENVAQNIFFGEHKIPVGIINYDVSMLRTGDRTKNITNKQFEKKQILVISPLIPGIKVSSSGKIKMSFKNAILQKTNNKIKTLKLEFEDQQYSLIEDGRIIHTEIELNVVNGGKKYLKFYGDFVNGNHFVRVSSLTLYKQTTNIASRPGPSNGGPVPDYVEGEVRATELWYPDQHGYDRDYYDYSHYHTNPHGITEGYVPTNLYAYLKYRIHYANGRRKIMKPVILLDGIDFNLPGTCRECDRSIDDIETNFLKYYDPHLRDTVHLIKFYNEHDFDVIIVDFPVYVIGYNVMIMRNGSRSFTDTLGAVYRKGGADYIQRNAKALEQFLRIMADSLHNNGSNERMVVIGPSMGGQTSRYALAEMERRGEDHHVRLWVSHDSPQQGANIPVGLQSLSYYYNKFDINYSLLNRPAPRELLVQHINNHTTHVTTQYNSITHVFDTIRITNINGNDRYRDLYNNELQNLGYPRNCIKLAIANGSYYGRKTGNGGDMMANIDISIYEVALGNRHRTNFGDFGRVFKQNGNNSIIADITRIVPVPIITLHSVQIVPCFTRNYFINTNNDFTGSYDVAPGCIRNAEFSKHIEERYPNAAGLNLWAIGDITSVNNTFTFMSPKSTLDFLGYNRDLNEPLCRYGNLIHRHLTPFDSYYAPRDNEPHNHLTAENVEWLWEAISQPGYIPDPPSVSQCPVSPAPITIEGPNYLAVGSVGTYRAMINEPVTWNFNRSVFQVVSQRQNTIKLKRIRYSNRDVLFCRTNSGLSGSKFIQTAPFAFRTSTQSTKVKLIKDDNISDQEIVATQWKITRGSTKIIKTEKLYIIVDSDKQPFEGVVTVTLKNNKTVTLPFQGGNVSNCYHINKVGKNKYRLINSCNNNEKINSVKVAVFDMAGMQIGSFVADSNEFVLRNMGKKDQIRILKVSAKKANVSMLIKLD